MGGYNLDAFVPGRPAIGGDDRLQPRPPVRRLGGDARRDASRPSCGSSSCPAPGRRSSSSSPTCSRPWRRPRSSCGIGPAAVEVVDKYVLDSTRLNPEATPAPRLPPGRSRGHPADRALRRARRRAAAPARRPGGRPASATGSAITTWPSPRPPQQARIWKLRDDGAGAVDGREGGRQGDLVRRGHGRRPRAPARLHRRVPGDHRPARDQGRASTPMPRSAACTSGR